MAQFYPSLFSFYVMESRQSGPSPAAANRSHAIKEPVKPNAPLPPAEVFTRPLQSDGRQRPLFLAQKQFLSLIEELCIFTPCEKTLNSILAYATGKSSSSQSQKKDDNNYDPQGTISVCN